MPALFLTADNLRSLAALREKATTAPLTLQDVLRETSTEAGTRAFRDRQHERSIVIHEVRGRFDLMICFSIMLGQPTGPTRHMSVSTSIPDTLPAPEVVEMIADQLGFVGGLAMSEGWLEDVEDGHKAVNLVQPIAVHPPAAGAAALAS